jgi:alkaline phosphatase
MKAKLFFSAIIFSVLAFVKEQYGLGNVSAQDEEDLSMAWKDALSGEEKKSLYGKANPITVVASRILAKRAGFKFTSGGHTAADIPVYALGTGAENFFGNYENTEIFAKLRDLMKLSVGSAPAAR